MVCLKATKKQGIGVASGGGCYPLRAEGIQVDPDALLNLAALTVVQESGCGTAPPDRIRVCREGFVFDVDLVR